MNFIRKIIIMSCLTIVLSTAFFTVFSDTTSNNNYGDNYENVLNTREFIKNQNEILGTNLDIEYQDIIAVEAIENRLVEAEITKLLQVKAKEKEECINYLILRSANINKIELIKDKDILEIAEIVRIEKLSDNYVKNLTDSWAENAYNTSEICTTPLEARPNQIPEAIMQSYSLETPNMQIIAGATSITDYIVATDGSGSHYMVRSYTGYNKASGYFTIPTYSINTSLGTKHDVPYGFFGLYTNDNQFGMDLGVGFDVDASGGSTWFMDLSGYVGNGSGTYKSVWKSIKIVPGTKVYIVAKLERKTSSELTTVTVTDATTWTVLGSLTYDTVADGAYKAFYTSNTSFGNLFVNREVSLAFPKDLTRLPNTGSYIQNAKWDTVNIYNATGYGLWTSIQTNFAHRQGRTQAFCNAVNVTVTSQWNNDSTNITY